MSLNLKVVKVFANMASISFAFLAENVVTKGKGDIIDHLKSLGGSPFLNGASWDPSKFNVSKIIEQEPYFGTLFLLDYEFTTTPDHEGYNKTHAIPTLIKEGVYSIDEKERATYSHYITMLGEMKDLFKLNTKDREAEEAEIEKAVKRLDTFTKVRRSFLFENL